MAGDTNFVALRIAKVGAIVVGMVLRPQAGWSLTGAAICKACFVRCANLPAARREEGRHLPIARMMRLAIVWLVNDKERS